MHPLVLLSLLYFVASWLSPQPQVDSIGELRYLNFKKKHVSLPNSLEQALREQRVYEDSLLAAGSVHLIEKLVLKHDSLMSRAGNTGLFDTFCDPYEPAMDLNITGQPYERATVSLLGRIPYSRHFTTSVVHIEYDVRSNCDNKVVVLLLNTKGSRILSMVRVAQADFQRTRLAYTSLTQSHLFSYENEPQDHVHIDREGLKALKAMGRETANPLDDMLDFIIYYTTFRITKEGFIEVVEKGKV